MLFFVSLENSFAREERITKPESQKTGIETTQPISSIARVGFFSPTRRITKSASLKAAPVFSSTAPMKAPKMITIPMDVNVDEKPDPITPGMSFNGSPASRASTSDIAMMARKGWTFNLAIMTIIKAIATTKAARKETPVI